MSYGYWKPYVPVAKRRAKAEKAVARANQAGQGLRPVVVQGRAIAKTFWGKAWCDNLEAYSDFENRLPRGRAYVRNGSVIDLKIEPGRVLARVIGSSLYEVEIGIAAVPGGHWKELAQECTGSIASLVELLQGRLSAAVMERICRPRTGLFPTPEDIRLDCSCPDWASMCKHVAAVLYGVGARLDAQPELLFTLRQVDASDLVTQAAELSVKAKKAPAASKVLDASQLADVFGIEIDHSGAAPGAKKQARGDPAKATNPPLAAATKAPAKTLAKAKPAAPAQKKKADPRPPGALKRATAAPAAARNAVAAAGKRAARQLAPAAAVQAKKKKARA